MPQRSKRANASSPFENARHSIERELNRLQKQLRVQSRTLEKRIEKGRRQLESRFEKGVRQLETRGRKQLDSLLAEIRGSAVAKRARTLRADAQKQIESGVETVLARLPVASRRDVDRIEKQLRTVTKKLSELERARSGRAAAPTSESRSAASA